MPHVTQAPAPVLPAAAQGTTNTLQPALSFEAMPAAGTSAGVTQAQRQVLLAYRTAVQEYEARRRIDRWWMPMNRSTVLVPLWQKVENQVGHRTSVQLLGITATWRNERIWRCAELP